MGGYWVMWECAGGCSFLCLGLVGLYFAVYICSQVMLRVRCSLAVDGIRVSCMFFNLLFCPFICLLLSISLCRFCILCFHFGVFVGLLPFCLVLLVKWVLVVLAIIFS